MHNTNKGDRVRKRVSNACQRCRQQKTRCSGSHPCTQCTKRHLPCTFEDRSVKILVTRGFISDLENRIASLEQSTSRASGEERREPGNRRSEYGSGDEETDGLTPRNALNSPEQISHSGDASPELALTNDLGYGNPQFISDTRGNPIYMGTSSNWSFGRRILATAHEKILLSPLPINNLLFQGQVYNLSWSNDIAPQEHELESLPSADFAMYLINAVNFHCGQIFHLFDEQEFMQRFTKYYDGTVNEIAKPQIWYTHFLLILALGKAFVVRDGKDSQPAGANFFTRAMRYLPNIAFVYQDEITVMELLCCAALYLQSIDFRCAAYILIGQALRSALNQGLNTSMRNHNVDDVYAQRCRKIWWTVLILDRQMSALQGVPISVRNEDIHAELPSTGTNRNEALRLHATLSHLVAEIVTTVYGTTGRLGKSFLIDTKAILRKIGDITDPLNLSFPFHLSKMSRLAAYLHLLYHQCVLLASRPLFFSFFQMRLDAKDSTKTYVPRYGTVRSLLSMGLESSHQVFKILEALRVEGLLETFLPFDLEATFTAATILQMAHAADNMLVPDPSEWAEKANKALTEMIHRGNLVARYLKSEMDQLADLLARLPNTARKQTNQLIAEMGEHQHEYEHSGPVDVDWQNGFTTGNFLNFADALDIDGLDWLSTSTMGILTE